MQRREPTVIDAVHEAERIQQGLDNIVMAVPRGFVQSSIAELSGK